MNTSSEIVIFLTVYVYPESLENRVCIGHYAYISAVNIVQTSGFQAVGIDINPRTAAEEIILCGSLPHIHGRERVARIAVEDSCPVIVFDFGDIFIFSVQFHGQS